jgi:hypothetical protein
MSLVIIHGADGKILGAFRPQEGKRATPALLEGQFLLEFAEEPVHLASLSIGEIGLMHAVDVKLQQLISTDPA